MSQLELFKTKEQEARLQSKIENYASEQLRKEEKFDKMRTEFFQAGMIQDKHFTIEGNGWVTEEVEFNYGDWSNKLIEIVTVKSFEKSIRIKAKYYSSWDGKIMNRNTTPDFQPAGYRSTAKFNCWSLQDSSRYIKATTLKDKIEESWVKAEREYNADRKKHVNFAKGIKQLEKKFPTAEVTKWYDNLVNVNFPSGSYMRIKVLNWDNEIDFRVDTKYDVATTGLKMDELGAYFAAQPSNKN